MILEREEKAHITRDLRALLIPHFWFRMQIQFPGPYQKKITRTFYGHEHQCTYNQCLAGRVPHIILSKAKGYRELINLAEKKYRGKYLHATIYMREDLTDPDFKIICRYYERSKEVVEQRFDPPLDEEDEVRIIYYTLNGPRLQLHTEDPAAIDFKKELEQRL